MLRRNARVSRQQNTNINNQLSIENQAALREELSSKNNAIDKRHLEKWREARSLIYPIFIEVLEKQRMQMLDSESKALIQLIKTSRDYLIVIELIKHIVKNLNVSTQALQKTNNMILHKDNTQAVFWKELAFVLLSALILTITVSILTMMCFTQIACWSTILSMCLLLSLEMSLDARASDACISQIQENIQEKIAVELEQVVNAEANEIQFDTVVEEYLSTILVPKMSISTTEKILEQLFSKARILMKKMESIQPEINESQTTLSHSPFSFFPLSNSDKPQNHSLVMSLAPH